MRLDDETDRQSHVPGAGFSIHLISGISGTIQAIAEGRIAQDLKQNGDLLHRARASERLPRAHRLAEIR